MIWIVLGTVVMLIPFALVVTGFLYVYRQVHKHYLDIIERIFQEKPLFIIPRGEALADAESVTFPTAQGQTLRGCYLKTTSPRKGVILFGLEYGSDRWSCRPYCDALLQAGYDIFAFEPRNQGQSDPIPGYEPLQWITDYEVADTRAALAYLKQRPDRDPKGIGFLGVSKGANAGLYVAARDRFIRCIVTDGAFATFTTMVPYMRKWVMLYNNKFLVQGLLPFWFLKRLAMDGLRNVERARKVHFVHLEPAMRRLRQPLFMIHGEKDTYIKPQMALQIFRRAKGPKEFWLVPNARHNQAINLAGAEYSQRVLAFFDGHMK